jgi:hypothetical protein
MVARSRSRLKANIIPKLCLHKATGQDDRMRVNNWSIAASYDSPTRPAKHFMSDRAACTESHAQA